jgi:membrane associated rhomboid family serine protease
VILFGAIELLSSVPLLRNLSDGVAHLAHLGGLLFGFLYLKRIPWRWFGRRRSKGNVIDIRSYRDRGDQSPWS